ncbi:hypothetical protein GUITHDRAFT_99900 [Guillardia theta CCMP2712]|uniref:Thioredoxin domain-containing protein n=1 Tax=Guillardia theta (strain CCMP2712) TaxID=905079 RepID=L1K0R2_GUITC|nr:hypothetical protein GUITHDRAFT_99900 [Guillardia theta CCMP2712]EKX54421.1 hypothetical protein GUITHDRAFT_99900 [Guillardia theta CCMP2712]|eukprot:XP_005841401.1 hypothetical protein GUITHDRAFT_99900 [Guillardia theta CCMP2712]
MPTLAQMALSWRKIKHDLNAELTEGTITGSIISILTGVLMVYLIVAQIFAWRALNSETSVVLDHYSHMKTGADSLLQINFNFTFNHLSCEYASVDAANFMGTHDAGISSKVTKVHLDKNGRQLGVHKERKNLKHTIDEAPHEGESKLITLTAGDFDKHRFEHEILVVNFYTPWCHWCQKLEPVWEKSAKKFGEAHPDDARLVLAKVDCTSDKAESLCTKYHIDAFPSIMVFRKDDPLDKDHEKYHGERSVDAIVSWAEHLMKQVNLQAPKSRVVDKEQDGEKESHNGVGCMVAGMLHVQRAPGSIILQAVSDGHEFNWATMDVSHTVNHLSFGPFLSETAWVVMPPDIAQAVGSLDDKKFLSEERTPTVWEHYVKVVKNVVELPRSWGIPPVEAHGYVVHTNKVQRYAEVPTARINYDILPIIVHVKTSRESNYHFLTKLCAIVGGVFTVSGIFASMVEGGIASLTHKETIGKLG